MDISYVLISPGLHYQEPDEHYIMEIARKSDWTIVTDIDLLLSQYRGIKIDCKNRFSCHNDHVIDGKVDLNVTDDQEIIGNSKVKFIGVTGTNGKSTTVRLIEHLLNSLDYKVQFGGNIGIAALSLDDFDNSGGIYVLEMSSYQLELGHLPALDIAVIMNITEDHLDRHLSMENYINAKSRIFMKANCCILNISSNYCNKLLDKIPKDCDRIFISQYNSESDHTDINVIMAHDYKLYDDKDCIRFCSKLFGEHNMLNIAAAYTVLKTLGIPSNKILSNLDSFVPLEHRMELVHRISNIKFINDSKATNVVSTVYALSVEADIYWIVGGEYKHGSDYRVLLDYLSKVKCIYIIGKHIDFFTRLFEGLNFKICNSLEIAVNSAYNDAKLKNNDQNKDILVLLSPATASFDQFKNFIERGKHFTFLVKQLFHL